MATSKLFIIYYYINHRTIPIRGIYRFYKSSLYRDIADILLASAESITSISPGLSDLSVSLLNTRLPYRPSIIIPNTISTIYSPALGLVDN
jgi:hypothetical protein